MHLGCKRNCFALSQVERRQDETALRTENFEPIGRIIGPISDLFWRGQVLQLSKDSGGNQNAVVELPEEVDLGDQNEVVERRCVGDDNHSRANSALTVFDPELTKGFTILLEVRSREVVDLVLFQKGVDLHPRFES